MNDYEIFNVKKVAELSGVEYHRLRNMLSARKEKVTLTPEERQCVVNVVSSGVDWLKDHFEINQ